jgi:hypothetical protein
MVAAGSRLSLVELVSLRRLGGLRLRVLGRMRFAGAGTAGTGCSAGILSALVRIRPFGLVRIVDGVVQHVVGFVVVRAIAWVVAGRLREAGGPLLVVFVRRHERRMPGSAE